MHGTHRYAVGKALRAVPQIQILSEFPNTWSISHYSVSKSRFCQGRTKHMFQVTNPALLFIPSRRMDFKVTYSTEITSTFEPRRN